MWFKFKIKYGGKNTTMQVDRPKCQSVGLKRGKQAIAQIDRQIKQMVIILKSYLKSNWNETMSGMSLIVYLNKGHVIH